MATSFARPPSRAAFASPVSVLRSLGSACSHRASLTTRRAPLRAASPRRRPRRAPCTAVFIWNDAFDDDAHEDVDDADDEHDGADPDLFDATDAAWGRAQRSVDSGVTGASSSSSYYARLQSDDEQLQEGAHARQPHEADDHNPLFVAIRRNTQGPDDLDRLRQLASEGAAETFRDVVIGVLGNMPSDVYEVIITTDRSGMSRLMHSSLSTGYALRNAEFRMLLNENMNSFSRSQPKRKRRDDSAVRDLFSAEPLCKPNVPRRAKCDTSTVNGVVTWWDTERESKQELTAAEYVAKLEAENELLRERLTATQLNGANRSKLMAFVRTLTPQKLTELQANLSDDVVAAFKSIVKSVLGELNVAKVQMTYSTTRDYMAQLTFWCLLVGYSLRNIEKRMEMTKIFENTEAYAESALSDVDN